MSGQRGTIKEQTTTIIRQRGPIKGPSKTLFKNPPPVTPSVGERYQTTKSQVEASQKDSQGYVHTEWWVTNVSLIYLHHNKQNTSQFFLSLSSSIPLFPRTLAVRFVACVFLALDQ